MANKPGRNDPCPCGSGKKYKKCCGDGRDEISPRPASKAPGIETGTKLDALLPSIESRMRRYGLAWLLEHAPCSMLPERLQFIAPLDTVGIYWSECGVASQFLGAFFLHENIGGVKVTIKIPYLTYSTQKEDSLDTTNSSLSPLKNYITHEVILTDSGEVIDTTGFRHVFNNGSCRIALNSYPWRNYVEDSLREGLARPFTDWSSDWVAVFCPFKKRDGIGCSAFISPLSFDLQDERRFIGSQLNLAFLKEQDGSIRLSLMYESSHYVYIAQEALYKMPQSFHLEFSFPLSDLSDLQQEFDALYRRRDVGEMLNYIETSDTRGSGWSRSAYKSANYELKGVPNEQDRLSEKTLREIPMPSTLLPLKIFFKVLSPSSALKLFKSRTLKSQLAFFLSDDAM